MRIGLQPAASAPAAARGRSSDFSWAHAAGRLIDITNDLRAARPKAARTNARDAAPQVERSPYWLGLRVSVVVPTHNRKEKLLACLDALARQSVLPQEFEVVVVDDGSTDGTREALEVRRCPFALRYFSQEAAGPGAARNLGIERAAGELVLFIGDDILADERLIEEHLLAHAANPDPGAAVLGHIDWPRTHDAKRGHGVRLWRRDAAVRLLVHTHGAVARSPLLLHEQHLAQAAVSRRRGRCRRPLRSPLSPGRLRRLRVCVQADAARPAHPSTRTARARRHDHWMDLDSFAAPRVRRRRNGGRLLPKASRAGRSAPGAVDCRPRRAGVGPAHTAGLPAPSRSVRPRDR